MIDTDVVFLSLLGEEAIPHVGAEVTYEWMTPEGRERYTKAAGEAAAPEFLRDLAHVWLAASDEPRALAAQIRRASDCRSADVADNGCARLGTSVVRDALLEQESAELPHWGAEGRNTHSGQGTAADGEELRVEVRGDYEICPARVRAPGLDLMIVRRHWSGDGGVCVDVETHI